MGRKIKAIDSAWFQQSVVQWYEKHGRKNLPWQKQRNPYRVWLSEIMLQQTQVITVIPYYERFTARFPDVQALANAHEDEVLSLWSGLGYYARARNLHKAAQLVVNDFQGEFPRDEQSLISLPGIGRSTANAIRSLAMKQSAAILDGNVKRVLIRSHAIEGWSGTREVEKQLWELSEHYTPQRQFRQYNQAMMDIGASLCSRSKTDCEHCPLNSRCLAYAEDRVKELPHRKPQKALPTRHCQMLIIRNSKNEIFMEKRPSSGLWGGLWGLPQIEAEDNPQQSCQQKWQFKTEHSETLTAFRHTFSHFHLTIQPILLNLKTAPTIVAENNQHRWVKLSQLDQLGLSSPVKKILIQQQSN